MQRNINAESSEGKAAKNKCREQEKEGCGTDMKGAESAIDAMKPEDCCQVYEIEKICFPGTSWTLEDFQASLNVPEQYYAVARQGALILGFAALYMMADTADLVNIAVLPAYRGRGIGGRLMEALLRKATDARLCEITLEVRVSNKPAIHLYERFGFSQIAIRRKYYKSPVEDAGIMQRHFVYA